MPTENAEIVELDVPGLRGRATPFSHPFTNMVGVTPHLEKLTAASVEQVIAFFKSRHQAFGWVTGPQSPKGTKDLLLANGLDKIEDFSGMALTDLSTRIATKPGVRVVEVSADEQETFSRLLARAEGLPGEISSFMSAILYFNPSHLKVRNYFAYLDGIEGPVGLGSMMYYPATPAVLLAGAAVLEAHRHQGAYRGLLWRRLADARQDGAEAALIQAAKATAAPICQKMGFEEICQQELYAWETDTAA
jgi:hypothetical protein